MEYATMDDGRLEYSLRLTADWSGPTPEKIRDELVGQHESIDERRVTNRSTYPDTRLTGVEFAEESRLAGGHVTPDEVEIPVDGFDEIAGAHEQLAEWFAPTDLECPELADFDDVFVLIEPVGDWGIDTDPSKALSQAALGGKATELGDGTTVEVYTMGGDASISFRQDEFSVDGAQDVCRQFFDLDVFVLVPDEEIKQDDGWS